MTWKLEKLCHVLKYLWRLFMQMNYIFDVVLLLIRFSSHMSNKWNKYYRNVEVKFFGSEFFSLKLCLYLCLCVCLCLCLYDRDSTSFSRMKNGPKDTRRSNIFTSFRLESTKFWIKWASNARKGLYRVKLYIFLISIHFRFWSICFHTHEKTCK